MLRRILLVVLIVGSTSFSVSAKADLIGHLMAIAHNTPNIGSPCTICIFSFNTFVAHDPGIETILYDLEVSPPFPVYNVDFAATSLTINFLAPVHFVNATFNGPIFTVLSGNLFDPIGTVSGIDPSRVTETTGQLFINLANYQVVEGTPVVINFAVPGPIAGAGLPGLLLAGGGFLAWWRRKRKQLA
jgi:hypothetical protein